MFELLHKQHISNQRGFTLIELMATLAILALIVLIAVPSIGNIVADSEEKAQAASISMIEKSGAIAETAGLAFDDPETQTYDVSTLISEGYLDLDADDDLAKESAYVVKIGDVGHTYVYNGSCEGSSDSSDFEYVLDRMTEEQALAMFGVTSKFEKFVRELAVGEVMITGYTGDAVDVVVPSQIECAPVGLIHGDSTSGIGAFTGKGLESVVIPDSVTSIAYYAFKDNNLKEVVIPDSVTLMQKGAFDGNPGLTIYGGADSAASKYVLEPGQTFVVR